MRILGLDIGSASVKAVEIETAFGRHEVHEYHEAPVGPGEDPTLVAGQLLRSLPKKPDKLIVGLRSGLVTLRNPTLPTKDRKAIANSVEFELDDDLPFSVEQAAFGYSIFPDIGNSSPVHVLATLKKNFREFLDAQQKAGIDADVVTSEAWAMRCLTQRIPRSPGTVSPPVLVANLGHQRSALAVIHQGRPIVSREIPWGGAHLAVTLSEKLGISLEEADRLLIDPGLAAQGGADDPASTSNRVAIALQEHLQKLVRDLKQTELTAKGTTTQDIGEIALIGKCALIPGLAEFLEQETKTQTSLLPSMRLASPSGVAYAAETDAQYALAVALALTAVGPEQKLTINLRKGEFAKNDGSQGLQWKLIQGPLAGFSIVVASLIFSLIVEGTIYRTEIGEADTQLERALKGFFGPTLSKNAIRNHLANTSGLRKQIQAEIEKEKSLAELSSPNNRFPFDFVKKLSGAVAKETVVDLVEMQVGAAPDQPHVDKAKTQATLSFVVANPQMAEKIAIAASTMMSGFSRSKLEEVTISGQKKYKIILTGEPLENTYGR